MGEVDVFGRGRMVIDVDVVNMPHREAIVATREGREKTATYHHGDLRQALLDAALEMVRDEGVARATSPEAGAGAGTANDWSQVRQRMAEMGVERFWIEGQPGGPVRFRCVVPLAGDQVVSQHFEAEADDAVQAAEVALGRVALWKATAAGQP